MNKFLQSYGPLALLLAVAFVLNLWGPPLFDLDEGAFSAATLEMLQRGDYVTTWLNGEPRFDKPILIYWLQALSTGLAGTDEFFYRLPSALAAIGWSLALYFFARERFDADRSLVALVFLCSAAGVVVIGRAATADALLNLWLTLAGLDGYRAAVEKNPRALWRAWVWIGLGILTKGPVGAVVPFMALSLYSLVQRDLACWVRVALFWRGWILAALIFLPWYILEYLAQGQAFIDGFFLQHNLGRFTETMESHGGTPLYYIPGILLVSLPFAVWVVRGLASIRLIRQDALLCWCWGWFLFVFLFFSFSGTQLPHYVLYGMTPLVLLMSSYGAGQPFWWFLPALILPALGVFLPDLISVASQTAQDPWIAGALQRGAVQVGWATRLASVVLLALLLVTIWRVSGVSRVYLVGLLHSLFLVLVLLPAAAEVQQAPVKQAAILARDIDQPIVMWRVDMPSFTTYRGQITPRREPVSGEWVFTREGRIDESRLAEIAYRNGGILLARVR